MGSRQTISRGTDSRQIISWGNGFTVNSIHGKSDSRQNQLAVNRFTGALHFLQVASVMNPGLDSGGPPSFSLTYRTLKSNTCLHLISLGSFSLWPSALWLATPPARPRATACVQACRGKFPGFRGMQNSDGILAYRYRSNSTGRYNLIMRR